MTVLIASLFLPYTVEFHLNEDAINPELINSLAIKTKPTQTNTPNNGPTPSVTTPIPGSGQILSNSILAKKSLGSEEFRTTNSSIEDFFYQSPPAGSPAFGNSPNFNEELKHKLTIASNKFVPKARVIPSNQVYQKSSLNLQREDDTVSISDDDFEFSDDDGYDTLYNHRQKIPKFGGYSNSNVVNPKSAQDVYSNSSYHVVEFHKGNGALSNAISTSLKPNQYKWVGTIGIPTDDLPDNISHSITETLSKEFNCESVLPSDFTFQGHYKNYCKHVLWPTLHYQIPDDPNSKAFEDHSWEFYKQLNQQFAEKIVKVYKPGDVVWVHDYHLLLVPEMVREKIPDAQIGFYLHVSFPSSEVFKCFAQRESMLKGILGANFVSFQTDEYVRHFSQTCNKLLLADISNDEIRFNGRAIKILSSPVGIDANDLSAKIDHSDEVLEWRRLIRERWPTQKLIVGRDKFDKIRGVKQKLLSYELFLKNNPDYIDNTVLIQICLKTKDHDTKSESEIMSIVDRINSLSPNISSNTQPVVFLHQDVEFVQYLGLLVEADLFIVSSMREGMNLTCHEFIVATKEKKSPLLLSEFTGSASVFTKGAFKINPWDIKKVSLQIKEALELDKGKRASNWEHLIKVVKNQDCHNWVNLNLNRIKTSWKSQNEKSSNHALNVGSFTEKYRASKKRLLVFHITSIPSERMLKILNDLIHDNEVYIFSGYRRLELERLYRPLLPKVGLIAENGGLIKLVGSSQWTTLLNIASFKEFLKILRGILESYEERIPESFIETGETFIKFHTEKNDEDPERKNSLVGDLITHINDYEDTDKLINVDIHATVSDDIVYVQHSNISQTAIKYLIDYYSNQSSVEHPIKVDCVDSSSASSIRSLDDDSRSIDFLTIGGKSDFIFEPVLEYANLFAKKKIIPVVFTIGYNDDNSKTTVAEEQVEGLNELFTVLANI